MEIVPVNKSYLAILIMMLLLLSGCGKSAENISDETGSK